MAIELVSKAQNGTRALTSETILRGSEVSGGNGTSVPLISGTPVISGSPSIAGSPVPAIPELWVEPEANTRAFRGIAFSLIFEAALAAAGYALWQVWKLL